MTCTTSKTATAKKGVTLQLLSMTVWRLGWQWELDMEWQLRDKDYWVFGHKVRGVIRCPVAEVYYDEDLPKRIGPSDPRYGWVWTVDTANREIQGVASKLGTAIEACEKELGIDG